MSAFLCPACDGKLTEAVILTGRALWCANPKCNSVAADVGGEGRTSQEAFAALEKAVEAEREADLKDMRRAEG
jgi:hypothetical protein